MNYLVYFLNQFHHFPDESQRHKLRIRTGNGTLNLNKLIARGFQENFSWIAAFAQREFDDNSWALST